MYTISTPQPIKMEPSSRVQAYKNRLQNRKKEPSHIRFRLRYPAPETQQKAHLNEQITALAVKSSI